MSLLEEQPEQVVALRTLKADDPGGEGGVDEQHPASGLRVTTHHGVLDGRELLLERGQLLRRVEAREARKEVVDGTRTVDPLTHPDRQVVVRGRHVRPHRVASHRRHLPQLQHGTQGRAFTEGYVRVPDVLVGGNGTGRLVEADHVVGITLGEQRIGLQLTPVTGELTLRVGRQVLAAEEEHLPFEERAVQLLPHRDGQGPREVEAADLRPDDAALRNEFETLVRPLPHTVRQAIQDARALVQAVGGNTVVAQG